MRAQRANGGVAPKPGEVEMASSLVDAEPQGVPEPAPEASEPLVKPLVHELLPMFGSRSRFFLGGRCITGPLEDWKFNGCVWAAVLLLPLCYLATVSGLWREEPAMPLMTLLLFASTILFLLLSSCTDPGIIPRRELQFVTTNSIQEVAEATGCPPLSRVSIVFTREMDEEGYRFCPTCKIVRPPRASHCARCNNCVLRLDHHCPFVNNCIGQRNYAYFVSFLISAVSLGVSVFVGFGFAISGVSKGSSALQFFLVLIAVPTAAMLLGTLGLGCFHTFVIASGRTTKEICKGRAVAGGRAGFFVRGPALLKPRDRTIYPDEVP